MRIIYVWVVAITLLMAVTIGWYISLPISFGLAAAIEGRVSGSGLTALMIVEYAAIIWGPLCDIFIVAWAFLESHRVDITSQAYE